MVDILIKNGLIVDGSGAPAFKADIAVKDGVTVKIAPGLETEAAEVIDASGLEVSPGFIDCHTHSDSIVFTGSDSRNFLEQGVTTQIAGNCGSSPTPYYPESRMKERNKLTEEEFRSRLEKCRTPGAFMAAAEKGSYGTNIAFFAGHSPIRGHAMGYTDGRADAAQMADMKAMLEEAMQAGFLGMSTGLVYAPSVYADTEELIELSSVLHKYDGIYVSHIRGEGDNVMRAFGEAVRIGKESGCRVEISHLKVMGRHNEGRSAELLAALDKANDEGGIVNADQYPYTASSAPMQSQIPPKYLIGGVPKLLERIKDMKTRDRILWSIFHETDEFESGIYYSGFEGALVTSSDLAPEFVNKTLTQIAQERGIRPIDALCEVLLANDGYAQGCYFNQNASDLLRIMQHPRVFCGADASDRQKWADEEKVGGAHPRGTATMIRRLELVRDFRLRTMEESVKNLTYDAAQAFGLPGIGLIKEGWAANIAVFAYDRLHARADYVHPYRKGEGIYHVIVNGKTAVRDGVFLGVRNGKVIKRGR